MVKDFFVDIMNDSNSEKKEKRSNLTRVTAGLDDFDYKVISRMASKRTISLSEVVRIIVHKWIEYNPELLKKNYGIDLLEITEELERESYEITVDKELKAYENKIIKELPVFFEIVREVSIKDLAQHFDVDEKVIKRIVFIHGREIEKIGLKLIYKGDRIYKE
ncbi:MAG: hypothetical protein ACFE9I_18620 [Candidatus Hermodarchaeota archaeon]